MIEHKYVEDLYATYYSKREKKLNLDEFSTFVSFYPAVLIAKSDGKVDTEEWLFIKYLARFMSQAYAPELSEEEVAELEEKFQEELEYIVLNSDSIDNWDAQALSIIKTHIKHNPDFKEELLDIVQLFAEASDGVGSEEQEMIEKLKKEFNL